MILDYKLIGERLKNARLEKRYTQEKLAECMNVSIAYVSRIETGKTELSLKRLVEMCNILGLTPSTVLEGVSSESENYLNVEFNSMLKDCTSEEKESLYNISIAALKGLRK